MDLKDRSLLLGEINGDGLMDLLVSPKKRIQSIRGPLITRWEMDNFINPRLPVLKTRGFLRMAFATRCKRGWYDRLDPVS